MIQAATSHLGSGGAHLAVNHAVDPLGRARVLGLDGVDLGLGHGGLLMGVAVEAETVVTTLLEVIVVLAWVGSLVLEPLEDLVASKGQERTHEGTEPVDPVVADKIARDDGRTKRTGRVDRGAGPVGGADVCDEDGDTNANWGQVGAAVLLNGQEVHSQHQLSSEEHLHKDTLGLAGAISECVGNEKRAWGQAIRNGRSCNSGDELCGDDQEAIEWLNSTDEQQTDSHLKKSKFSM